MGIGLLLSAGCAQLSEIGNSFGKQYAADAAKTPLPPLSTNLFIDIPESVETLGALQMIQARPDNTLAAIAREFGLGYDEIKLANPSVDPWLPGENTRIYLPTFLIVPQAKREGIVINLPNMRLLHFNQSVRGDSSLVIASYPIGIGREGWATPQGRFHITEKTRDPNWYPPESVRKEHAEMGNPLPKIVPPGPENPLGRFKMRLSNPEYLIHGTNKPSGVGMRVSHGCIRLYPEHIADLFETVAEQTTVQIVNQPVLAGWYKQELYLEVHPLLTEDNRDLSELAEQQIAEALQRGSGNIKPGNANVDKKLVAEIVAEQRGIPIPITANIENTESFLATARLTQNMLPNVPAQKTAAR